MEHMIFCNTKITNSIYSMDILAPQIAKTALPGQFLNVSVPFDNSKILRRPISICDVKNDSITIVYQTKGEGTNLLSKLSKNDNVDILGPLGNGFPLVNNMRVAIVGGGIGIFPLLYLKKKLVEQNTVDCYLGFRNSDHVVLTEEFKDNNNILCIATDDGSLFNHGYVTSFFEESSIKYDVVYSCGPLPMLKTLSNICDKTKTVLYISLEQRMGCGIGACLVCACKVKADTDVGFDYLHVCKDGPVFDSREVLL